MKKSRLKRENGQSLVEFALILPVLLMLLCGIIDFGYVYYNQMQLINAAREGARYTSIHYDASNAKKSIEATEDMIDGLVTVKDKTITVDKEKVTAELTADAKLLTGFTSTVIGKDSVELHASCTMRLEN